VLPGPSDLYRSHSGRARVLHLLPLSRAELAGQETMELAATGRGTDREAVTDGDLFECLHTGGYPRIHTGQ